MARAQFTSQMEEHLLHLVRNGEDGNIYRCLVLRSDNQKLKVRDAWTWVHNSFNRRFGTQIPRDILRKKFSYLRTKNRSKAVSEKEKENKKTAKTLAEFRRINNKTGGYNTTCPRSSDRVSRLTYYIKWVTTSWTDGS